MANDTDKITCYSYTGTAYSNNTKCPNSDSCCQTAAQCRDDRLCTTNDDADIFLRATCANKPWSLSTCAQICLYDNKSGYLPRVNICSDGSYCCDNDPTCCVDKSGFFLSNDGEITGYANQTTTTSATSTASSSLTSSTAPATNSASATDASSSSSGLSTGGKVGVGVGVGVGGLALVGLGLFYLLWRRRSNANAANNTTAAPIQQQYHQDYAPVPTAPAMAQSKPLVEMDSAPAPGTANPAPWFDSHAVSTVKPSRPPVELPDSSR